MGLSKAGLQTLAQHVGESIIEYRPHLKATTVRMYSSTISNLTKKSGKENLQYLQDPEFVKSLIKDMAYTTRRNVFATVSTFMNSINVDGDLDTYIKQYDMWRDELNEQYASEMRSGYISKKQDPNFIDMKALEAFVKKIKRETTREEKKGDGNIRMVAMLFQILLKYPLRNDLAGLTLVSAKGEKKLTQEDKMSRNYLVKDGDNFTIVDNVYKTSKHYGENRLPITDPDVAKALRSYLRMKKLRIGAVLFPITTNYLSQLLIKYSQQFIGKSISTTMIRKIVTSHKFLETKEAQEKHAKMLGHSVGVENAIYIKKKLPS